MNERRKRESADFRKGSRDQHFRIRDDPPPRVLEPFDRREAMSIAEAAEQIGYAPATVRRLVASFYLGRRIGQGHWRVSRIAFRMFADNDANALAAYHAGRRDDPRVQAYFQREGI